MRLVTLFRIGKAGQRSGWRQRSVAAFVALLVTTGLVGFATAPANALTSIPVPDKILRWVFNSQGASLARAIFEAQGDTCLPQGVVCYMQGSYDPPRWGKGTVQTGDLNIT